MINIVLIVLPLVSLIAGQAGMGDVAYFTDTEQSANNTVNTVSSWNFLHPDTGVDETDGTYTLSAADLATLAISDDSRYATQDDWDSTYSNNKSLIFTFPDIPGDVTLLKVSITVEWLKESKVLDGPGNEQIYALTLPEQPSNDHSKTIDVSAFINTAEKVNNLEVWFQVMSQSKNGPKQTKHDLVEVIVAYE